MIKFFPNLLLVTTTLVSMAAILPAWAAGPVETETLELQFKPYSSSYLPMRTGPLTERGGHGLPREMWRILPQDVADLTDNYSTMQRFDMLRKRRLGRGQKLENFVRDNYFKGVPTPFWWGYCDRWTAAAMNPEINAMVAKADDLVCDGVHLTKGELKDLLTAFYRYKAFMFGFPSNQDPNSMTESFRNETGRDDVGAAVFHEAIFSNLRNQKAIGMDRSSDHTVWNHPIFKVESERQELGLGDLSSDSPSLSAKNFQSSDPRVLQWLSVYERLEPILEKMGNLQPLKYKEAEGEAKAQADAAYQATDRELFTETLKLSNEAGILGSWPVSGHKALVKLRRELFNRLLTASAEGKLSLKPGLRIVRQKATLHFGIESGFGGTGRTDFSTSQTYEYLLVYDDQGRENDRNSWTVADSGWITKLSSRPDFLWTASHDDIRSDAYATRVDAALSDTISLVQSCPKLSEVQAFLESLSTAASDRTISAEEKSKLLEDYSKIKGGVNFDEVSYRLRGSRGLTIEELKAVPDRTKRESSQPLNLEQLQSGVEEVST